MKKIALLVLVLCAVVSVSFAEDVAAPVAAAVEAVAAPAADVTAVAGVVVDNAAVEANRATIAEFAKTYTKDAAVKGEANGYSIVAADGKICKLDADSNAKVVEFLKGEAANVAVAAEVKANGEEFTLVSIK
jgi:hypothetical protein